MRQADQVAQLERLLGMVRTNTRDDGYGGSLEGRLRSPLEVFDAVRSSVGKTFVVGSRFLAEECISGGSDVGETRTFGLAFVKAGMDFLSTSRGGKFDDAKQPGVGWAAYPYTGPSGYECMPQYISDARGPFGRNAAATAARGSGAIGQLCCLHQAENWSKACSKPPS